MEFDRKTILAFVLIGLILVLVNTNFYKRMVYGDLPQEQPIESTRPIQPDSTTESLRDNTTTEIPTVAATVPKAESPVVAKPDEHLNEREIIIDTPLYFGVFSTVGGNIKHWEVKKYHDGDGNPVVLVDNGFDNLSVVLPIGDTLDTGNLLFECNESEIVLQPGESRRIVFEREIVPGALVRKEYRLAADDYKIQLSVRLENVQNLVDGYNYDLLWHSGLESTEKNLKDDMSNAEAYARVGDVDVSLDVKDDKFKRTEENDRDIRWAAIRTKYFAVAIIPRTEFGRGIRLTGSTTKLPDEPAKLKTYGVDLRMPLARSEVTQHDFDIYLGPLDYQRMKALNVELEQIMNLGWAFIKPFTIMVLWALRAMHEFIPNYGIVIIIFSILVKVVLHPLTKKSYVSMKQMQLLQPKMAEIREKYGKDPQKMNAETMKLYREYGVNPLGGCLPMVLQMPLLFALFTAFRSTIEFRQAYFFGWIKDLSVPDTIFTLPFSVPIYGHSVNVLPLIMGVSMFLQQKLSTTDPKQKAMVYIMPVFLTLVFNSFPSGLNLYYTLFNIFSIIQQKYMTKAPSTLERKKSRKKAYDQIRRGGLNAALSRRRLMKK